MFAVSTFSINLVDLVPCKSSKGWVLTKKHRGTPDCRNLKLPPSSEAWFSNNVGEQHNNWPPNYCHKFFNRKNLRQRLPLMYLNFFFPIFGNCPGFFITLEKTEET